MLQEQLKSSLEACWANSELYVGRMGWDWMVIIGHRSSKSTFGANKTRREGRGSNSDYFYACININAQRHASTTAPLPWLLGNFHHPETKVVLEIIMNRRRDRKTAPPQNTTWGGWWWCPVHFSYRHGHHGGGHTTGWGGIFDWWWYAILSRVKQITRVLW